MKSNSVPNESKQKRSAFTVINNVRDNCKQSVSKKLLMLTLATYCDGDGKCFPSNATLATVTGISERTIRRMLTQLVADGELEKVTPGLGGRNQKRVIQLKRYLTNPDTAMATLTRPRSLGKTSLNSHREQPKVRTTRSVNGEHNNENTFREGTTHNMQATAKEVLVLKVSKKTSKKNVKEEAPAERGYVSHQEFVGEKIANILYAKDNTLKFTPAVRYADGTIKEGPWPR